MKLKTTTYIIIGLLVAILAIETGFFIYVRSLMHPVEPHDYQCSQLECAEAEAEEVDTESQSITTISTVTIRGLHRRLEIDMPDADFKSHEAEYDYITPDTLIIISPGMIFIE